MKNFTIFFLFLVNLTFAQPPEIGWQKRFGGNFGDIGRSMKQTPDGGFIMGGYSLSDESFEKTSYNRGGSDYWIIKTDANGTIVWDKTIGGSIQTVPSTIMKFDVLKSIIVTPDGGYLLSGESSSPLSADKTDVCRGDYDFWILKLSSTGDILWQKTIGAAGYDVVCQVINTLEGGYMIAGISRSNISGEKSENAYGESDIWLVKISEFGIIEWEKTYGGTEYDGSDDIIQNPDGSYVVIGSATSGISGNKTVPSKGESDIWILKIAGTGDIILQKAIGGTETEGGNGIISTTDGNYLITSNAYSGISGDKTEANKGMRDVWILKLDQQFNILWQKAYGGNKDDQTLKPLQTADGGYLISTSSQSGISGDKTSSVMGYNDAWLLKLSATGDLVWQKTIGGTAPGTYRGQDGLQISMQLADGSFILFGQTDSDVSGDIVDFCRGDADFWLLKLNPENLITNQFASENGIIIYPNPAKDYLTIADENASNEILYYKIFDNLGRTINSGQCSNNSKIDVSNLANGNYFLKLNINDSNFVNLKFIKN